MQSKHLGLLIFIFLHIRREVLANASVVEEDYFVAPPGNIPLKVDAEDKYGR